MDDITEQKIRERAYALWEKEGAPDGRDLEFWERARLMLEAEQAPAPERPMEAHSDEDEALEATFPASDPPSFGSATPGRAAE